MKPRLPSHYILRFEPPGSSGDESIIFTSARRRVVVKGHSFREFLELVVPLLDGHHTLAEIQARVAGVFAPEDLAECIALLSNQRLIEDADIVDLATGAERMEPQLNYFREVSDDPRAVQDRLAAVLVTVVGLGALGAVAATALAAAGVGHIRFVESLPVARTDPFLSQLFSLGDVGKPRAAVVEARIAAVNPATQVESVGEKLETDADVAGVIAGSDFVLGCLDPGLASLTYKLNRACLQTHIPWCAGETSAFEGVVGPTVLPHDTACYLCYQMRLVACTEDPGEALAGLKHLDRRNSDDSGHRENLAFGAGIVGNMMALEAFKTLIGGRSSTAGKVVVLDFGQATSQKHVVLRKPWCPACFVSIENTASALQRSEP